MGKVIAICISEEKGTQKHRGTHEPKEETPVTLMELFKGIARKGDE